MRQLRAVIAYRLYYTAIGYGETCWIDHDTSYTVTFCTCIYIYIYIYTYIYIYSKHKMSISEWE